MLGLQSKLVIALLAAVVITAGGSWLVVRAKDARIEALVAQLAVSQGNAAALEAALAEQNAAIAKAASDSSARRARAASAAASAPPARRKISDAMAKPAAGSTVGERVEDVDRRFLEALQ